MTSEEIKTILPILQAFSEGKEVEVYSNEGWTACSNLIFSLPVSNYRIKPPEPKLRPWKPEEVPVGALLRRKFKPEIEAVILGCSISGFFPHVIVSIKEFQSGSGHYLNDLLSYHGGNNGDRIEHSTDNGKTWHPCGVLE